MMAVGDHQGLGREPRRDLGVRLAHPERVLDPGLIRGGRGGAPRHRVVQEPGERFARTPEHGVDTRQVRPDRAHQLEAVLDRPGHRPLVRHDRAAQVLELHRADHASDRAAPAVQGEPHLVRVEGRTLGRDERTPLAPCLEFGRRLPILVGRSALAGFATSEDEADHVVRARLQVVPPLVVGDHVVGRGRDQVV
jgi:hypothetical protein